MYSAFVTALTPDFMAPAGILTVVLSVNRMLALAVTLTLADVQL